ncbi:MAG: response regulator [Chitinophaga sp.]|uniref:ATP-binding protein n=1 Tax=Chitinophaga sp. TaxID=1869181 RepID=UPI0025C3C94A|nr:ATP-binding protein [Chitinophaga sp.]MBV8251488.1 response regulator [Chitinophaga sp.]
MHNNHERKTFVRFAVLTLMIIVMISLFMIIFFRKRTSEQLGTIIREMGTGHTSIVYLDRATQLLYKADNNFRLYTVTYDKKYFNSYREQLNGLKLQLDSVMLDSVSTGSLHKLLNYKSDKMGIFLQCSQQLDSLLQIQEDWKPAAVSLPVQVLGKLVAQQKVQSDTIVTTEQVTKTNKKKLFGRLKDAITNKSSVHQQHNQVSVVHHNNTANNNNGAISQSQLQQMQASYDQLLNEAAKSRFRMNAAEQDLVATSSRLFDQLETLLQNARRAMTDAIIAKQAEKKAEAGSALYSIWQQSYWEIPLILLLAGIIIYGMMRLYRYDLALLRSKQQAERLARQKAEFAATVSHELRTPIHSLLGYSQQLNREYKPETVSAIRTAAEMLLQVVNNVLDYTKIETEKLVLKQEKFSPRTAIEEVCEGLRVQSDMKSLIMTLNIFFPTSLQVSGDAFRLKQVITNLVANAIKYTDNGEITVTASVRNTDNNTCLLEVSVTDTGIGIHNRDLPQLFDAFTQADQNDANAHKRISGSGLGLHIAKKIIDLHEGKIHVKSIHGKGSTFFFEIKYPMVVHSPATRKITVPVNAANQEAPRTSLTRILVVEDNVLNQKLLSLMLDRMQVYYKVVSNAEEALVQFGSFTFDMVFSDIDLPGMDGLALAARIRQWEDKEKAAVKIVAITGNILEDDVANYLRSGFNDYISKPYREEDILEKIQLFGMMA